jgi:glycosyltransferase involved in cell wall biosynthesis
MEISIITATFNAASNLPNLVKSLREQSNNSFEWIVADGGSNDNTLSILNEVKDLKVTISSQSDFGIYDALNRAIKLARNDYYVVIGSDDTFSIDAVENFLSAIDGNSTIITTPLLVDNKIYDLSRFPTFISGFHSKICGHSIATLFKKSLHDKYGYYSKKYPIAADYEFMMKLILNNEPIKKCNFIAGSYGTNGISSIDKLGSATEVMRIMIANRFSTFIQLSIFLARIIYFSFFPRK